MDLVQKTFGASVAVLPVIHIESAGQAAEEVVLALKVGASGVFLISHQGDALSVELAVSETIVSARQAGFMEPWIGVNLLGYHPWRALEWVGQRAQHQLNAVWSDESGVEPCKPTDKSNDAPKTLAEARAGFLSWRPLFFGGVAFKHQPQPKDLALECERMIDAGVDVLTTSGPATGKPCDPSKVAAMRAVVGHRAVIAVASGATAKNAYGLVKAGATILLVATGVAREGSFYRMNPNKLAKLLEVVR